MKIEELEAKLDKSLPVHSVQELEGFPYVTYAEFLDHYRKGEVIIKAQYDNQALHALARKSEIVVHLILASGPYVVMLLSLIVSLALRNFWLLTAIPLAGLGLIFGTTPGSMKAFGNTVLFVTVVIFLGALFNSNVTTSYLAGAYCISNGLTVLARHQCAWIMRRGTSESEFVLIALYLERKILIQPVPASK